MNDDFPNFDNFLTTEPRPDYDDDPPDPCTGDRDECGCRMCVIVRAMQSTPIGETMYAEDVQF